MELANSIRLIREGLRWEFLVLFLIAAAVSAAAQVIVVRTAHRHRLGLDTPDAFRKEHATPIPHLGGVGVFLGLLVIWLIGNDLAGGGLFEAEWRAVLISCGAIFLLGLIDDFRPLGAKIKLAGQLAIAVLAWFLGLRIDLLFYVGLGPLGFFVTIAWLVAIPNVVNLIDGMDGLAGGVSVFLCITLTVVGLLERDMAVVVLSLGMAGAVMGFLIFNLPPAKVFLGDAGAYLLGFFVSSTSVASSIKGSVAAALLVIFVALGLPILDAAFAIIRRGLRGTSIFRADGEHIHHRALLMGHSPKVALLWFYGVCCFFTLAGLSILLTKGQTIPVVIALVLLLVILGVRHLGYVRTWRNIKGQLETALARRGDTRYAMHLGAALEQEVDRLEEVEAFRKSLESALAEVGLGIAGKAEPEGARLLEMPLKGKRVWLVTVSEGERDMTCWQRIAEAFLPALARALQKWNGEALGVRPSRKTESA